MSALPFYDPNNKTAQARPVKHLRNLLWWALLILAVIGAHELPQLLDKKPPLASQNKTAVDSENEAFIALVYGKISQTQSLAISASAFESQLEALQQAGYKTVKLAQINQWRQIPDATLPAKPVLLTFEEANRETLEIADAVLAKLGMNGVIYVDVEQIKQANIHLVSWHRLEQLAKNGRWEIGISGCPGGNNELFSGSIEWAEKTLKARRALLENRLQVPVETVDCSRSWQSDASYANNVWHQTLQTTGIPIGFVAAPLGANYRTDTESAFRRIRVSKQWDTASFISVLNNHTPRRNLYHDDFKTPQSAQAWIIDRGHTALEEGGMRFYNSTGEQGALILLSGTDKWQSAEAEVTLANPPHGQFWLSLRHRSAQPSIRLGIAEGKVALEAPDGNGGYHLLANRSVPSGNITLKLRVIGHSALGYLNGEPLLERPSDLPKSPQEGALAMAVWNKHNTVDPSPSGESEVLIREIKAKPLFTQVVVTPSSLSSTEWQALSTQTDKLSAISPGYYAWLYGKPEILDKPSIQMEIFANYHHLDFVPAVFIEANTAMSDSTAFTEQILKWAMNPAYDGLNIILNKSIDIERWKALLDTLNKRLSLVGKILIVTVLDDQSRLSATGAISRLLPVVAHPQLLSNQPEILHPL